MGQVAGLGDNGTSWHGFTVRSKTAIGSQKVQTGQMQSAEGSLGWLNWNPLCCSHVTCHSEARVLPARTLLHLLLYEG